MPFFCNWAFETLVVTCDGTVVCGCADPANERPVGHLSKNGLLEIWNGPQMTEAREAILRGEPGQICKGCGLGETVAAPVAAPIRPAPRRLLIEPTIVCNLRCPIESCDINNGASPPRERRFLDLDEFRRAMDEVGPQLERVQFYNYGEPFIHRGTLAMVRYLKDHYPHVWVDSSTNGHFFQNDQRRQEIVDSGIDRLIFSVDGATQKSYERYRKGGDLQRVLDAMAGIVGYRTLRGRQKPEVMWRYILFDWNDGFFEMRRARQLARDMGIDVLCWHLSLPVEGASRKYRPQSWATRRIWTEFFESGPFPNALPERKTSARPSVLRARIRASAPRSVLPGASFRVQASIKNTGDTIWLTEASPAGRFVTLGVDWLDGAGQPIPGQGKRVYLPKNLAPGQSVKLDFEMVAPAQQGRSRLRLDMVNELYAWFGDLGSQRLELELATG